MRVVRFAGENVSPSDDGRLYDQIFENGLFDAPTIAPAGGSQINIGPLYGIIRGRDFTTEAQTIDATLPTGSGTATGVIYAEIDLSNEQPLAIKTALEPWTPTDENINVSGVVAQVKIGTYTANPTAVTAASYTPSETPASINDRIEELQEEIDATNNNIGNVLYRAMNIQNGVAQLATSPTFRAYEEGEYFFYSPAENQMYLYRAKTNISAGTALVDGTNMEIVVLANDVKSINDVIPEIESALANYVRVTQTQTTVATIAGNGTATAVLVPPTFVGYKFLMAVKAVCPYKEICVYNYYGGADSVSVQIVNRQSNALNNLNVFVTFMYIKDPSFV